MKKLFILALTLGMFMTAGAQVRVNMGLSFGTPFYGYRAPVVVTPRPHMYYGSPRVIYARPRYAPRVVVVGRGRGRCR